VKTEMILALDVESGEKAIQFLSSLSGMLEWVKVGSQLFVSEGPEIVKKLKSLGYKVFLDLKLHDIPNTVASAIKNIRDMNVDMLTVHVSGGRDMLISAKKEAGTSIKVVGVTVLTSLNENDLKEMGVNRSMEEQVLCLAKIAQESGIDGVVCSPMEAGLIRNAMGKNFIIVTPGIRFEDMKDDQKRALSPSEIKDAGVNYIVVGRPVLKAENPVEVVKKILHSLK